MGLHRITKCFFTDNEIQTTNSTTDIFEYFVVVNNKKHLIRLSPGPKDWLNKDFFKKNKNNFFALLYNDDWFDDEQNCIELENLESIIKEKITSLNPEDKLEKLFFKLFSFQKEDGEWIKYENRSFNDLFWKTLYFKSLRELKYYIEVLESNGLIENKHNKHKDRPGLPESYRITFNGLNHAIKLKEEGEKSNKCFVAMAFKPETKKIRSAIKAALKETGFNPIIIDEQNIDCDRTINDEIIANLKRCNFCISDFTLHSKGVYFESGFALGQGKKVIYTCRKDEFKKSHFDLKPLQHIIYENEDELKTNLINKIEAWIK